MKQEIFRINKIFRKGIFEKNNKIPASSTNLNFIKNGKQNNNSEQSKKPNWTKEQDQLLIAISSKMRRNKWTYASKLLRNKSPYQCYVRHKIINPKIKKGRWAQNEDDLLIKLVRVFGHSWNFIAKIIKTRTNKQVRNRYKEYLDESLNKEVFSQAEDLKLLNLYKTLKSNWYKYKLHFPNRSNKRLKSRITFLLAKQENENTRDEQATNSNNEHSKEDDTQSDLERNYFYGDELNDILYEDDKSALLKDLPESKSLLFDEGKTHILSFLTCFVFIVSCI